MLKFIRTTGKEKTITEYEYFELDYVLEKMTQSFWDGISTNQAVINDKDMIIYVMDSNANIIKEYEEYKVINIKED